MIHESNGKIIISVNQTAGEYLYYWLKTYIQTTTKWVTHSRIRNKINWTVQQQRNEIHMFLRWVKKVWNEGGLSVKMFHFCSFPIPCNKQWRITWKEHMTVFLHHTTNNEHWPEKSTWAFHQRTSCLLHCRTPHSSWGLRTKWPADAWRRTRSHLQQPAKIQCVLLILSATYLFSNLSQFEEFELHNTVLNRSHTALCFMATHFSS